MLQFEKRVWQDRGLCIGIDEVGRGAYAGPMAIGGVVFDSTIESMIEILPKNVVIRDSKKMTQLQRERAYEWIKQHCIDCHVVYIENEFIDANGLSEANQIGYSKIANYFSQKYNITHLLIDAFELKNHKVFTKDKQFAITRGEDNSLSIAAAAIIAKVERDSLMRKLSKKYPKYFWHKNKGYGTAEHRNAMKEHGLSEYHRKSWGK